MVSKIGFERDYKIGIYFRENCAKPHKLTGIEGFFLRL